ncbi:murein biosynthesis integral membrane protein MurJ [Sinanaerobacter sp. ZZT-01]|uniref:murein biosynthesis integral membrane protein MurJ n=1 Tax=Sinanaerobacter sp. ZZT-01 TaxID=3111540 RepID=UPI002D77F87D|nr:murein biosynthesis integral membrane protein MurJ [Sinanaerobacter sp. ZZT-01]WRR94882.1 murein biosynthesis integral membrane protein MurJ [Sinanaerobacter sp. ZZT-01]
MRGIKRTAAQTAVLMAGLTLGSKLLGFIREMVMASAFGTSYVTDAYVLSTAIPTIVFGGLFGAVATAYIPLFSEVTEHRGKKEADLFTSQILNLLFIISIISSIFGFFFSDMIIKICAPGFTGETAKLASFFVKATFSYIIFTSTASLLDSYLQYKGYFLLPIISGYMQNVFVIGCIVISALYQYYFLAFGLLIGCFVRFLIVFFFAVKKGFRYSFDLHFKDRARSIMILALPVFIGSYINQINLFVDKSLASQLPEGSASALNYGYLLVGIVTGLTISIITTVIYPKLTQAKTLGQWSRFEEMICTGINLILIIALPCTFGGVVYSSTIVQIVYERGAFDSNATMLTQTTFLFYIGGLLFFALAEFFTRVFYSMKDTKSTLLAGAAAVIVNITLNLILVRYLAHGGLALATSISSACNVAVMFIIFRKKYNEICLIESWSKLYKIAGSAIIATGISYAIYYLLVSTIWMPRMIYFGLAAMVDGIVYIGLLSLFRIEEVKMIRQVL